VPASAQADVAGVRVVALASPYLDKLTRDNLLNEHGRGVRTVKVRRSKDVVISGNHYDCVYLNHDGWLACYKILHNGSRQIMDFILPGQVVGLQACLFHRAHLLLELFVRLNRAHLINEMTFSIPLTQELIADALGLTTVHVNRTLRALREDKLIAMDGRSVTILDFEALSLLSDFENSYLGEAARTLQSTSRAAKLDGLPRRGKTAP
jgi:CRP-like cAMP-binding protein